MGIEQMRTVILSVYPGDGWKQKVKKMKDNQVMAVYMRFLQEGKLKK